MHTPDPELALLLDALEQVNLLLPDDEAIAPEPGAPLARPEGPLDSLGLVNLIVAVEERVQREWGGSAGLMEALEIPEESSPFRRVETLAEHLRGVREGIGG